MLPRAPAEAGEVDGAERFEELNAEGFTFTSEMVVWTEGLILNELKWEMNVVTPFCFASCFLQKLDHMRRGDGAREFFLPGVEYVHFVLEAARRDLSLSTSFRPSVVAAGAIIVAIDVVRSVTRPSCSTCASSSGLKTFLTKMAKEIITDGSSLRPFTRQQKHQQISDEHGVEACVRILKERIFHVEPCDPEPEPVPVPAAAAGAGSRGGDRCVEGERHRSLSPASCLVIGTEDSFVHSGLRESAAPTPLSKELSVRPWDA